MRSRAPLEVWKFGGASLADAKAVDHAAALIAGHPGPLVVVASALAGITDLAARRRGARHGTPRRGTPMPPPTRSRGGTGRSRTTCCRRAPPGRACRLIDRMAREFLELCGAVAVARRAGRRRQRPARRPRRTHVGDDPRGGRPRRAAGERTSTPRTRPYRRPARRGRAARRRNGPRRAWRVWARSSRGGAGAGRARVHRQAPDASVTTLGRGGSDLTATLLARAMGARRVHALEGRARHPHRRSRASCRTRG